MGVNLITRELLDEQEFQRFRKREEELARVTFCILNACPVHMRDFIILKKIVEGKAPEESKGQCSKGRSTRLKYR